MSAIYLLHYMPVDNKSNSIEDFREHNIKIQKIMKTRSYYQNNLITIFIFLKRFNNKKISIYIEG